MTAEIDIAAIDDGGANTASEVRTALTSVLARADSMALLDSWTYSTDVASITFTGLPTGYTKLIVIAKLRTDRTGTTPDGCDMNLGDGSIDSGANYAYYQNYAGAASGTSGGISQTYIEVGRVSVAAAGETAGALGFFVVELFNYDDSSYETDVKARGHAMNTTAQYYRTHCQGVYQQGNVVDQIQLVPHFGANFTLGFVEVYGV